MCWCFVILSVSPHPEGNINYFHCTCGVSESFISSCNGGNSYRSYRVNINLLKRHKLYHTDATVQLQLLSLLLRGKYVPILKRGRFVCFVFGIKKKRFDCLNAVIHIYDMMKMKLWKILDYFTHLSPLLYFFVVRNMSVFQPSGKELQITILLYFQSHLSYNKDPVKSN